jgi:tetratricopeptide (TPR) repeat protein
LTPLTVIEHDPVFQGNDHATPTVPPNPARVTNRGRVSAENLPAMPTDYRYPGSRSFQDTDLDRKLFFGREQEQAELLHLILAEQLVVVFAKSGMGKTSLLNAGILQPLRRRGFLPIPVRLNDPTLTPLQTLYAAIKQTVAQTGLGTVFGDETSLHQYFTTAEFWSTDDTLLTPVLIFDQFEEFFEFYAPAARQQLIAQLAEAVKGHAANLKTIIALREDFLGELEELVPELPAILDNRFRLAALRRQQAQEAIERPAQLHDAQLTSAGFTYAPDTVAALLDFLCKRREKEKLISTDDVEPFQLQVLCQHLEQTVQKRAQAAIRQIVIQKSDLGGERGMQKVLQNFYDHQLKQVRPRRKRNRVRKLCEKGLLSASNRRLSLEEEDIQRRFKVPKLLLATLVDRRLLRADTRVGGTYYELSHDTLVMPIRQSQRIHKLKTRAIGGIFAILTLSGMLFLSAVTLLYISRNYRMVRGISETLSWPEKFFSKGYQVMGRTFSRKGDYAEAITQYRKALELDPKNTHAYVWLGDTLAEQGKGDEAILQYQKALETDPQDSWAYASLGDALSKQGKEDEAILQYHKALELNPQDVHVYYGLGRISERHEKYDEAMAQYQKAIEIAPQDPDPYIWLGDCLQRQGKYAEAITQYQKALEFDPQNGWARGDLNDALLAQGNYAEAIRQCQKMIEVAPESVSGYYCLADVFERQGKYDEAISQYRKVVELDPQAKESDADVRIGNALREQGKYAEALTQYQKAIELNPKYSYLYFRLGELFSEQGRYNDAIEIYQKLVEVKPQDAEGYFWLGLTFEQQGNYAEATIQYRNAVERAPKDGIWYVWVGRGLSRQGKIAEAISEYQKAIEIDPKIPYAYIKLGDALKEQKKITEAISQYQKALELDPNRIDAYVQLGSIAYTQGKFDEVRQFYHKMYEIGEKTYVRERETIHAKVWFAERCLWVENAEQAFMLADDVVKRQLFSPAEQLAMRFVMVTSLLYQQKRPEVFTELQALLTYYHSLTVYNEKYWDYETLHNVISMNEKLSDADKTLLLKLIDVLQAPKAEGDEKLKELEARLPELLNLKP